METTLTELADRRDEPSPITESRRRELAFRANHGIEVTLLWQPGTHDVTVCVCDQRTGAYFEIRPEPRLALDAFYHPYSYAPQSIVYFQDEQLAA
jgi:hypothetical protein